MNISGNFKINGINISTSGTTPVGSFGGMQSVSNQGNANVVNPYTGTTSCPAGFTERSLTPFNASNYLNGNADQFYFSYCYASGGAGGTAAGTTRQIQFNSSGLLSTSSTFVYSGGSLGIGTAAPAAPLHAHGSDGADTFRLTSQTQIFGVWQNTDKTSIGTRSNSAMVLFSNGMDRIWIAPAGNVGIGTTSPAEVLDVNGKVIRQISRATGASEDGTSNGQISTRILSVTKQRSSTSLRIAWADILRVQGSTLASCYWEIRIDGASCPGGAIYLNMYTYNGNNAHNPTSYFGYCDGVSAGTHQIQIWVHPNLTDGSGSDGVCYTGLRNSRWTLEAEEIY